MHHLNEQALTFIIMLVVSRCTVSLNNYSTMYMYMVHSIPLACSFVFVCFVALRPKSTAMVIAGRSVHLTTLFLGKLEQAVNQYFVHILSLVFDNNPS